LATWHFPSSLWPCALRIARGRKTTAQPQPSDSRVRREGFERCTPVGAAHCNLGTANGTHSTFVPHLHIYLRSCTGHRVCAYWPVCKTSGGQKAQACHSKASAPSLREACASPESRVERQLGARRYHHFYSEPPRATSKWAFRCRGPWQTWRMDRS